MRIFMFQCAHSSTYRVGGTPTFEKAGWGELVGRCGFA